MKATFKIGPKPEDCTDAIPFWLTPTERSWTAWITTRLEAMRRERNRRDALTTSKRVSK
jgi:hypothetical protein